MTTSTIGDRTVVVGVVSGEGDLEVMGRVEGDVRVKGALAINESGSIRGSVFGTSVRVAGTVEGDLGALDSISLEVGAKVIGDLSAPRVAMAEGASLQGMVRTGELKEAKPEEASGADEGGQAERSQKRGGKHKRRGKKGRPPAPVVPSLVKGTKGKKKGDKL